jgi:hypothetical protein
MKPLKFVLHHPLSFVKVIWDRLQFYTKFIWIGEKTMKCIQAEYDETSKEISIKKNAPEEDWVKVCAKFNDDVSRICDVTKPKGYTGLFECRDDRNEKFFYLVLEDKNLYRIRHKHFYDNLGLK